jgi:NAD(P)-dependent dehydrogenase (short-subunit alcohol dehydrogenase family)
LAAGRFGRGGYVVTLVGQSVEQMEPRALRDEGFDAEPDGVDLTDADEVTRLITGIGERRGRIDIAISTRAPSGRWTRCT